ncbi:TatD family hydrolase [Microbacterium xylanilyticum]
MRRLPPLDTHAHVALDIAPVELERLGAVVLIATRSLDEFQTVQSRTDRASVWGVGCHPSLVGAQRGFDADRFATMIRSTPYVAEVGLDGSSRVPRDEQVGTFAEIVRVLEMSPRVTSIHSYRAARPVLDVLDQSRLRTGVVLHWWLGTVEETREAVDLGCYFSVNYSMTRSLEHLQAVPQSRLLVETDHPSGDRFSPHPRRPGAVEALESRLAKAFNVDPEAMRSLVWSNFATLIRDTGVAALLPGAVREMTRSVS